MPLKWVTFGDPRVPTYGYTFGEMSLEYTVRRLSNNSHFPEFPLTSIRGVLYASAPPGDGCPGGCQGCDRASLWRVGLISMTQDSRYTCAAHVVG